MMRYEYQYVTSSKNLSVSAFSELLNVMGCGGWECMDAPVYTESIYGGHWAVWMERAIEEPEVRESLTPEQVYHEAANVLGIRTMFPAEYTGGS